MILYRLFNSIDTEHLENISYSLYVLFALLGLFQLLLLAVDGVDSIRFILIFGIPTIIMAVFFDHLAEKRK